MSGVTHRFHVFLTGDGKLMEVSNKDVGGSKCWSCDKDDGLIPCPMIDGTIRWGAFFKRDSLSSQNWQLCTWLLPCRQRVRQAVGCDILGLDAK